MIRLNTTIGRLEYYYSSGWNSIGGVSATGGTVTEVGGYRIHTFTSNGTFTAPSGGKVDVLMVGGGGSGGANLNMAGGGGAVGYFTGFKISSGSYSIVVGAGGVQPTNPGGGSWSSAGNQGSATTAFGETAGGGQGGSQITYRTAGNSGTMTIQASASDYTTATAYSNIAGGVAIGNAGAGGGGAGGAGEEGPVEGNSSTGDHAGAGGVGVQVGTITDGINNYYWAGGGGGEGYSDYAGNGGLGGGGGGGVYADGNNTNPGAGGGSALNSGVDGTALNSPLNGGAGGANTGGGGGGGSHNSSTFYDSIGGAGGSGIVIIRYGI